MEKIKTDIPLLIPPPEAIWIGNCSVCKAKTGMRCSTCQCEFYCCTQHETSNRKSHKKNCRMKLKIRHVWEKPSTTNKRIIDFDSEFLLEATRHFSEKYACNDREIGTYSMIPFDIRLSDDGRTKMYKVQPFYPQKQIDLIREYEKRNFDKNMYYEINAMGKSALFHTAILLALKELAVMYKISVQFNGDDLEFYGLANVKVKHDFTPVELIYDWSNKDPSKWKKARFNNEQHKVLLIRTKNLGRIIIDLTAPQYGIFQWNVSDTDFPVWICPEDKQMAYEVTEIIYATDVETSIVNMFETNAKSDNPDFYYLTVLAYKEQLIRRIISKKQQSLRKSLLPAHVEMSTIKWYEEENSK